MKIWIWLATNQIPVEAFYDIKKATAWIIDLHTLFPFRQIISNSTTAWVDSSNAARFSFIKNAGKQSKISDRSVSMAATYSPLFKTLPHSSLIAIRTDWQLQTFRKADSYGLNREICWTYLESCSFRHLSKVLNTVGRMLTDR